MVNNTVDLGTASRALGRSIKKAAKRYQAKRKQASSTEKIPRAVFATKSAAQQAAKGHNLKVKKASAWGVFSVKKK